MLPTPRGLLAFFFHVLVSAFNFHRHWKKFFIMIGASQEDIPASFPSSTVFVSSVGLSSWQHTALALAEVVSLLPEKSSAGLWLVCQSSPAAFLGTAVHIRKLLFLPVFHSNSKNRICFQPHTNMFLMYFHPSSSITASVRQWEHLPCGLRFLSWCLFLEEFICGCCNAVKDARPVRICAACAEGSRAGAFAQLLSWILQGVLDLELMTRMASEGNDWRLLTSCFQLCCDQAVVAAFWEDKHPITPLVLLSESRQSGLACRSLHAGPHVKAKAWSSSVGSVTQYPTRLRAFTLQGLWMTTCRGYWLCPFHLQTHCGFFFPMVVARGIGLLADA